MVIATNKGKLQVIEVVEKITMNAGITGFYRLMQVCQLMQSNRKCSHRQVLPQKNHMGINDVHNAAFGSAYGQVFPVGPELSRPSYAVEFLPSEICPRNFIVLDHTEDRSQIMYHPAIAHNLSYPPVHFHGTAVGDNTVVKFGNNVDGGISSPYSEDSNDINALLSLDYDNEDEGKSEEEVSTARTQHYDGSSSSDSCSNYAPKARKKLECSSSHHKPSCGGRSSGEGKRKKIQKMVKVLRGMVPRGNQINTATVLDEAVRYLKSMKVEVQKLGIGNLKQFP